MKFLLLTLITHTDPARSAARRLREVVDTAVLAEEVGFDGFYRERWIFHGHDPADVHVGAGSAGFYVARTAQEAIDTYRPIFENRLGLSAGWASSRSSRPWRTPSSAVPSWSAARSS